MDPAMTEAADGAAAALRELLATVDAGLIEVDRPELRGYLRGVIDTLSVTVPKRTHRDTSDNETSGPGSGRPERPERPSENSP